MDQQLTQALGLHRQRRLDEALQLYKDILQHKDPPLQVFLNSSAILRSQGNQEKAIIFLQQGLTHFPLEAGLWNNLGNCHMDLFATTRAVVFRKALSIKRGSPIQHQLPLA